MSQLIFVVDAFAKEPFAGNPAAVVPFEDLLPDDPWPDDGVLQAAAGEHNLSETAFIRPMSEPNVWALRWFTPQVEVPLCGHATLAAGFVALAHLAGHEAHQAYFDTQSGRLTVEREGDEFALALPTMARRDWRVERDVRAALGLAAGDVVEAFVGRYPTLVLGDEDLVRNLDVAHGVAGAVALEGVAEKFGVESGCLAVTAAAREGGGSSAGDGGSRSLLGRLFGAPSPEPLEGVDFVARFFGPGVGIPEDPVTGSMFCDLGPFWADRLGRPEVAGFQASTRGGHVMCRYAGGGQVTLVGGAVEYLRGQIMV